MKNKLSKRKKHGVPVPSQTFQAEQDLQLWNEIAEACSSYLSTDPQVPSALEELCFIVMGFLQKPQGLDEKDNTKRFLFHYSKSHDSGNSDITSSVLHPLLQLVPQLSERRLKRDKMDFWCGIDYKRNIKGLERFRVEATLFSGHAMEGDQQVSAKKNF
ncbi:neuromedin-U-25 [Alligator mississippiensis]|uniref:Neuromedin-U-25 n=1 Tax=Alligator mississippiensis TaxID=8496 RepID=A0A151PAA7_ALLMI|nr:neuromedin-U-25 [Alligator mississippiensis]